MPQDIDVSVLIPVFNEIEGLPRCYDSVVQVMEESKYSFEIVIVDDGSTDGSTALLQNLAEQDGRLSLITLARNQGQQRAMYLALKYCTGKAIVTFDSDLQFPAECIPLMAEKIFEGFDIVSGIRKNRKDSLFFNRIPSMIGQWLINRALSIKQRDFGSVKMYSAALIEQILKLPVRHVVIPAMAYNLSHNFSEIPLEYVPRKRGISKWSILSRISLFLDVYTLYARRPFEWLMVLGFCSFALGIFTGIAIIFYRLFISSQFSGLIIFFDMFLLATGLYLFTMALMGEFIVRIYRQETFSDMDDIVEVKTSKGGDTPAERISGAKN